MASPVREYCGMNSAVRRLIGRVGVVDEKDLAVVKKEFAGYKHIKSRRK
jgi:hypothetical protein